MVASESVRYKELWSRKILINQRTIEVILKEWDMEVRIRILYFHTR